MNQTRLKQGDFFGELALLYNTKRSATITAKSDCVLWALDRDTFNHIVKEASMKKRQKYEAVLEKMEILKVKRTNRKGIKPICTNLQST